MITRECRANASTHEAAAASPARGRPPDDEATQTAPVPPALQLDLRGMAPSLSLESPDNAGGGAGAGGAAGLSAAGNGLAAAAEARDADRPPAEADGSEFTVTLPDESNMMTWRVAMRLPPDSTLGQELHAHAVKFGTPAEMTLEVTFGYDFPSSPPFVRVVSPRFAFHTGHVTLGGSMCMQLLTSSGWDPSYTVESTLVMVRDAMISGNGKLDPRRAHVPYDEAEARTNFLRVARQHGWE